MATRKETTGNSTSGIVAGLRATARKNFSSMPQENVNANEFMTLESFARENSLQGVTKLTITLRNNKVSVMSKKNGRYYGAIGSNFQEAFPAMKLKLSELD